MPRALLYTLCLLFVLPAYGQKNAYQVFKGDTINRKDVKGLKQGVWRKYYRTDTLCSETLFKNDKPVGVSRTWYESGKLKGIVEFKANGRQSEAVSYHENGHVLAKGWYVDLKKDSVWNYYDENDSLKAVEIYKHGTPVGVWKVYYEGGLLAEEKEYVNGKRQGMYRQYNENGKLIFEMAYKDDKEDGPVRIYFSDGTLKETGTFRRGLKEGSWLEYDKRGAVINNEVYKGGQLVKKP